MSVEEAADPRADEPVPQVLVIAPHDKMYQDRLTLCDFAFACLSTPYTESGLGDMSLPIKLLTPTTSLDPGEEGLARAA